MGVRRARTKQTLRHMLCVIGSLLILIVATEWHVGQARSYMV